MNLLDETHAEFVNIDRRPDRRKRMEAELQRVGIKATRRRGLLPNDLKHIDPARIKGMWERPQKGAIGCHFSQVAVMEEALKRGKHALVMEDDLDFCQDFPERLKMIEAFMAEHPWDVFWLGGTFHAGKAYWHSKDNPAGGCTRLGYDSFHPRFKGHPRIIRTFGCFCTYAYFVNRDSIAKILELFETRLPESIGIDHLFIMLQPQLQTYAFVPGSCKQFDHESDIGVGSNGKRGFTKFSNFATLNGTLENSKYWYQNFLTDFDPETFPWNDEPRRDA